MFKIQKVLCFLMLATLLLTACGPAETAAPTEVMTEAPTEEMTEAPTEAMTEAPTEAATEAATEAPVVECPEGVYDFGEVTGGPAGGFLERAVAGEFTGTTVTVDGTQVDPDDKKMICGWRAFEEATGITVNYVGNKEFEARLSISVDAGEAPDIADFPQPGSLANYVRAGKIIDVNSFIPADYLEATYPQLWLDMATMEGPNGPMAGGVWNRGFMKSLVWYAKDDFDASGYTVPETWDELLALSDQIVADGGTPWCIGIESQAATGWVGTDWVEDVMLRTTSLENYDAWVAGTLKFDSPEVRNAFETVGDVWFKEGYVYGGRDQITTTFFGDSPAGLFTDPPNCFLHRQASFITGEFTRLYPDAKYKVDYDFFYLPPIDDAYGRPALGAADIYAMFNDRPEVRALMEYLTLPMSVSGFMNTSGALALQNGATAEMYANPVDGDIATALAAATSFRFDGSDLMPGEVGAGSFWKGVTDWASGAADLDAVLPEIDASWPQ
jgi:alpha-glucoside transport system substrate-binding protein